MAGLSPHVIRVWERRYAAVSPARTATNRRLFSDDQIERLRLLAAATQAGHKIGIIAQLDVPDLRELVQSMQMRANRHGDGRGAEETNGENQNHTATLTVREFSERDLEAVLAEAEGLRKDAMEAIEQFETTPLLTVLEQSNLRFGHNGALHRVVCPLARELGERWQRGEITAAHEHFASGTIRDFLSRCARPFFEEEGAPRAVVATPPGQLHELGAVIAAAAARNLGWRTLYLGAGLPAAEIAGAAMQNKAKLVLLSIVYPTDDKQLPQELRQLRRFLAPHINIVAGGRAARAYAMVLNEIHAMMPRDMEEFCDVLNAIRAEA